MTLANGAAPWRRSRAATPVGAPLSRFVLTVLSYYELCESIENAIMMEAQIKKGSRLKKLRLIEEMNPNWNDLYESIIINLVGHAHKIGAP